jgi:hypothetical protein
MKISCKVLHNLFRPRTHNCVGQDIREEDKRVRGRMKMQRKRRWSRKTESGK